MLHDVKSVTNSLELRLTSLVLISKVIDAGCHRKRGSKNLAKRNFSFLAIHDLFVTFISIVWP